MSVLPELPKEVFDSLPQSVQLTIRLLQEAIKSLSIEILRLQEKNRELENRLNKNSSNSSKPPSSDGLNRKPKSQRGRSGKKPGGQTGHTGKNLSQVSNPNKVFVHSPVTCSGCQTALGTVAGICTEKRQVFDVPQPRIEVVEHQAEEKKCPCCGVLNRGIFPEDVRGPVQYGERVQALIAYFGHQHFVPVDRVCQILEDIFGVCVSPGTCSNVDQKLYRNLEPFEVSLKLYLIASQVLHFDESGIRCEKKLAWVHVSSSRMATLYILHAKRGQEAMDAARILPQFNGFAVHDHWSPYFTYSKAIHALCNAHHLRELTFIHEEAKESWAKELKDLLIFGQSEVERYAEAGALPMEIMYSIEGAYDQIVNRGLEYHSLLPPLPVGNRGRRKQRPGKNLLDRLQEKKATVLWFLRNFAVPFTNNQGEQDIRMIKLKQKISGCFRTKVGGEMFCRIRSYLSTARKQTWNVWDAMAEAIKGSPYLLTV
jgi:transposase